MKELNEKLIISISIVLLIMGISFGILFPSKRSIEVKAPSGINHYKPIDIKQAVAFNAEWPKAKEQAKGEMFDLFTPPEIFINENGDFVFRPPYAVDALGPFGVHLLEINLDPYRFQLEGFVEEDRYDQNQTTILVHSVEDGKSLRLNPYAYLPEYEFKILDWKILRNFDDNENTEVIAWLKLKDSRTDRIINLRHDERLYEDSIEIVFESAKTNEIYVLRGTKSSFFIEDVEYRLDSLDFKNSTALMTKLIPDSEPISELLSIYVPGEESLDENLSENIEEKNQPATIEDAFNSFF